jgi:Uncharacterized protein containing a von Willebrand factor type A (vWA) domain
LWFKKTTNTRNVYLLLDRSGSMANGWEETLGAVNGYIEKLEDDVNVYFAAFDSAGMFGSANLDLQVLRESTAKDYKKVTSNDVTPRGGTPLYDAVGKVADKMIEDDPARAVLVIMTDGEENTSREYNRDAVLGKLKILENKDWPTVYLGSDFKNVVTYAQSTFNISSSNSINTSARNRGATMDLYATKTGCYFNATAGSAASTDSMKLTDDEKADIDSKA